jgi:hypothetical protein
MTYMKFVIPKVYRWCSQANSGAEAAIGIWGQTSLAGQTECICTCLQRSIWCDYRFHQSYHLGINQTVHGSDPLTNLLNKYNDYHEGENVVKKSHLGRQELESFCLPAMEAKTSGPLASMQA